MPSLLLSKILLLSPFFFPLPQTKVRSSMSKLSTKLYTHIQLTFLPLPQKHQGILSRRKKQLDGLESIQDGTVGLIKQSANESIIYVDVDDDIKCAYVAITRIKMYKFEIVCFNEIDLLVTPSSRKEQVIYELGTSHLPDSKLHGRLL